MIGLTAFVMRHTIFWDFVQKRRFAKNQCPVGIAVTHFITFDGEMHIIFSLSVIVFNHLKTIEILFPLELHLP